MESIKGEKQNERWRGQTKEIHEGYNVSGPTTVTASRSASTQIIPSPQPPSTTPTPSISPSLKLQSENAPCIYMTFKRQGSLLINVNAKCVQEKKSLGEAGSPAEGSPAGSP